MRYFFWLFLILVVIFRILFFYSQRDIYTDGAKIRITDKVSTEPIRYSNSQYFRLSGFKVYLPLYPEVHYRDRVVVQGVVAGDRLKGVELLGVFENKGLLSKVRSNLLALYQKALPQKDSALIAGVTIGSKANIGTDLWEALKKTGTAHVVVASGMNVSMVSKFLVSVAVIFFKRKRAILGAFIGVWVYALLSGFDAPIIRAAVMGSLTFTAQALGRVYYARSALLLSALGMLLFSPNWILDLGFHLSFLATASLMIFEAGIREKLQFIPRLIREDFSTSLAAQIGVAPVLFITFGQFNLLSPFINALILWTIVPMTIIGMAGGILGLIFEPIGKAVLLLVYPLTSWFLLVVGFFTNL